MALDEDLLLILKSSGLGDGEPDLGSKLLSAFLKTLLEAKAVPARIICMNSGVFLTTEGSPLIETLREFEAQGTAILSCGTCLDYYNRRERLRIGEPTNMKSTVEAMLSFPRILSP